MGKVVDIRTLEVKRQIRRHEYAVDADAVAEAIVRRLTARRAAPVVGPDRGRSPGGRRRARGARPSRS